MCSRCFATVRGLTSSAWAMEALVRPSATSRRIWISRSVRSASPLQAMAVNTCPACRRLRARSRAAISGARQADCHLVFDGYAAEELGVEAEAVESLLGEKVADHHRLHAAGGPALVD